LKEKNIKRKYHETGGFKFSIHRNWVRVQSAKRLASLKYAQFLMSITLLLLQTLVDLKRQFYGYLPAGYQNCRRAKQSTLDTA
jgi:hypothetical protein